MVGDIEFSLPERIFMGSMSEIDKGTMRFAVFS